MPFKNSNVAGTTPLTDYSGLKLSWVSTHAQLNAVEADNIRLAMNKYLEKRKYPFPQWFTIIHLNLVHKMMFDRVWTWAGCYRQSVKNIGVLPYKIPIEMRQLEEDIKFWGNEKSLHPIEIATRLHYRLVWIHPFENGNGRHGRLISDMVLRAFGEKAISWPRLNDNGKERDLYIQMLKGADQGDFSGLIAFFKRHQSGF